MPAFKAAVTGEYPAHGIELDIVFSKDSCPFVIHDETLQRTTNGKGRVEEHSYNHLRNLDSGSWFGAEHAGTKIPILAEVLEEFGSSIIINIEIKPNSLARGYQPAVRTRQKDEEVKNDYIELADGTKKATQLRIVLQLLEKYKLGDSIILSSFDHGVLGKLRELSYLGRLSPLYDYLPDIDKAYRRAKNLSAFNLHLRADLITKEWLSAWRHKWNNLDAPPVLCWSTTDIGIDEARGLFSWGVAGVFSNNPDSIIKGLSN